MKKLLTLAAMAAITTTLATAPAQAGDTSYKSETTIKQDDDGSYKAETSTKAEDAAGTTTKSEKKVDVEVDADGEIEKTVTTESSSDPKGLFNKSKVKTKDVVKKKKDGTVKTKHKKEVDGDTVEESETSNEAQ